MFKKHFPRPLEQIIQLCRFQSKLKLHISVHLSPACCNLPVKFKSAYMILEELHDCPNLRYDAKRVIGRTERPKTTCWARPGPTLNTQLGHERWWWIYPNELTSRTLCGCLLMEGHMKVDLSGSLAASGAEIHLGVTGRTGLWRLALPWRATACQLNEAHSDRWCRC